jgi:hypothetical protein
MRFSPADRKRLQALAELTQRSETEVVRFLIRSATPTSFGGLRLPDAAEQRASAPVTPQTA